MWSGLVEISPVETAYVQTTYIMLKTTKKIGDVHFCGKNVLVYVISSNVHDNVPDVQCQNFRQTFKSSNF